MSFSVGIIGLPNAGKSTLFKALTKKKVDIASYPFTTIDPNVGIVPVPDKRLEKIASLVSCQKITKTIIEFVDIAGLVKNAHKGEGLGNQFLNHIRVCDAVVEVVRDFEDSNIEHVEGEINPESDIKTIGNELLMKDLETIEKAVEKIPQDLRLAKGKNQESGLKKLELLEKIKQAIKKEISIANLNLSDEEKQEIKEYQLLSAKPKVYLFNIKNRKTKEANSFRKKDKLFIDLKIEEEASDFSQSEIEELKLQSQLDQLIIACYNILDLITFFTMTGNQEIRAWTLKNGSTAFESAGKVHSDFQEKFIRAEVISWQKLITAASWLKAKESGQVKIKGKEYIVQDGDIIEFKI